MTDKNAYLLNLIEKELSNEEICKKLNISKKQLKRRIESIKYDGYNVDKQYNYDGTFNYYLNRKIENSNSKEIEINSFDSDSFRALAIADTHFGHKKGNLKYIETMYEYCKKNNINIIIHCGDLFEGVFQSKLNHEEQIYYFTENFPYDENILMFTVFGNHEEEFINDSGINLSNFITKERDDIVPLGFYESKLAILDNKIMVCHRKDFKEEYGLKLAGHSHRYKFLINQSGPLIVVPTLSDYLHTTDYPGAVDLNISLDSFKLFNKLEAKHLTINKRGNIRETSTIEYPFKRIQKVRKIK